MSEQKTTVDVPEAAVVAAANAALDAGFVDPDDGTIPQWYGEDPIPVWTHPSEAVKVIIAAALPHLAPDREVLVAAVHEHFCLRRDLVDHPFDQADYDKADEILEILARVGGVS